MIKFISLLVDKLCWPSWVLWGGAVVKYTDLYLFVLFIFQTHACFVNDKKGRGDAYEFENNHSMLFWFFPWFISSLHPEHFTSVSPCFQYRHILSGWCEYRGQEISFWERGRWLVLLYMNFMYILNAVLFQCNLPFFFLEEQIRRIFYYLFIYCPIPMLICVICWLLSERNSSLKCMRLTVWCSCFLLWVFMLIFSIIDQ